MKAVLDHNKFSALRDASGFTLEKIAEELGITVEYVQDLCRNDRNISISLYEKICTLFKVELGDLLIYVENDA